MGGGGGQYYICDPGGRDSWVGGGGNPWRYTTRYETLDVYNVQGHWLLNVNFHTIIGQHRYF